jgi:hypothetical protein
MGWRYSLIAHHLRVISDYRAAIPLVTTNVDRLGVNTLTPVGWLGVVEGPWSGDDYPCSSKEWNPAPTRTSSRKMWLRSTKSIYQMRASCAETKMEDLQGGVKCDQALVLQPSERVLEALCWSIYIFISAVYMVGPSRLVLLLENW